MNEIPPASLLARFAAGTGLTIAAGNASKALDTFAAWFLAGVGAALALFISNATTITQFTTPGVLALSAQDFFIAVIFCVIQRYLHTIITSGANSSKEMLAISDKFQQMDISEFSSQMKSAYPFFLRPMISGAFEALSRGDLAYSGRLLIRLTLLQGLFFTIQMFYLISAISTVAHSIST